MPNISFTDHVFDVTSENSSSNPRSHRLSPIYSSKLYGFTFYIEIYDAFLVNFYTRCQISAELHFFLQRDAQLSPHCLLKQVVFLHGLVPECAAC